jgi:hypothetical protein
VTSFELGHYQKVEFLAIDGFGFDIGAAKIIAVTKTGK